MFNTEGEKSTSVTDRLTSMGFEPTKGGYDYVYNWNKNGEDVEDALKIAERVYSTLGDCGVYFNLETVEED